MLKSLLHKATKRGDYIVTYLGHLKTLTDQLAAIGEPIFYKDHVAYLLEGLPTKYDPFVSAIYNQGDSPIVEEI